MSGVAIASAVVLAIIIFVVYSSLAARFIKNKKFKELVHTVGHAFQSAGRMDLASGNLMFEDEVLVVHVCPVRNGLYLYKSCYCSHYIPWEMLRQVTIYDDEKPENRARVTISDDNGAVYKFDCSWRKDFHERVPDNVWLVR